MKLARTKFNQQLPNPGNKLPEIMDMDTKTNNILDELKPIYDQTKTIAVVGLSRNPEKASHSIAGYLQSLGYKIIPVNPSANELLGEKCYSDLTSIPEGIDVDVVQVFRKSGEVLPVVEQAITIGVKTIWMQVDIVNEEASELARQSGIDVVMDRCMRATHRELKATGRL